jgi:hypothetical protein
MPGHAVALPAAVFSQSVLPPAMFGLVLAGADLWAVSPAPPSDACCAWGIVLCGVVCLGF